MNMINISKITNYKKVKKKLTTQFNKTENISTVYTLTKTMRYKIFNQKKIIKTLDTKNITKSSKYRQPVSNKFSNWKTEI